MYPFITILNKNISTYGILMLTGVLLVFFLALKKVKRKNVTVDDMLIVGAFVLLFALVFANLLNILVTQPAYEIVKAVLSGRFEVFGGLVYYGGLIGGVVGGIVGAGVAKIKLQTVETAVIPYLPIGHAIGRIGCVMAGCCNGMEYEGPFALYYPNSVSGLPSQQGYFPVQLLEAVLNIIIAAFLIWYSHKDRKTCNVLFLYLILYSVTRFWLEFLRGDEIRGIYLGLSLSQWISVVLFILSAGYFIICSIQNKMLRQKA